MPNALFRCDGDSRAGVGHVVRCQALAAAFNARRWTCSFAITETTAGLLANEPSIIVPEGDDGALVVAETIAAKHIDCLIVDHYELASTFERAARGNARLVLVIDDLANRRHDCDVLLDTNPGHLAAHYRDLVGPKAHPLLGPQYALLRPQILAQRANLRHSRSIAGRLLITFGGADPSNMSGRVLSAIAGCAGIPKPLLIVGPANMHRDEVTKLAASLDIEFLVAPPDLPELLAQANFAVTAGGTTCFELAFLGIPMAVIVTADNQRSFARALEQSGAATVMGDSTHLSGQNIADAIMSLAKDGETRRKMAIAGQELVDGQGARRIVEFIEGLIAGSQREIDT